MSAASRRNVGRNEVSGISGKTGIPKKHGQPGLVFQQQNALLSPTLRVALPLAKPILRLNVGPREGYSEPFVDGQRMNNLATGTEVSDILKWYSRTLRVGFGCLPDQCVDCFVLLF
jgi:hypothetical protein